jgi:VCBS repeat-containing protein
VGIDGIVVSDLDVLEATMIANPTLGHLTVEFTVNSGTLLIDTTILGGVINANVAGNNSGQVTISGTPAQINTTLAAIDGLLYTPEADHNGSDTLTVTVDDAGQYGINAQPLSAVATVALVINPMNDPPAVAVPAGGTVAEDGFTTLGAIQVSDPDANETAGAELRVTLSAANGILTVNPNIAGGLTSSDIQTNGSSAVTVTGTLVQINTTLMNAAGVRYDPNDDFAGDDAITVRVDDLGNTGQPGPQVTETDFVIDVTPVNDAPVAVPDPDAGQGQSAYVVDENTVLNVAGNGVLDNDLDVDGDTLQVVDDDGTADGVYRVLSAQGVLVEINTASGTFSYDPTDVAVFQALDDGQSLPDSFSYRATDGLLNSQPASVQILVTGINDAPTATDDAYTVADNALLDTAASGLNHLLVNDTDPEGDPLAVVVALSDTISTLGATVTIMSNGHFVYDPDTSSTLRARQQGDPPIVDTFTYVAADSGGAGLQDDAVVSITVIGANTPPDPADDEYETMEDEVLVVAAPGVLTGDSDVDSDVLTVVPRTFNSALGARVTLNQNGSFSYDASPSLTLGVLEDGESLVDTFQYEVRDEQGGSALGTVFVTVNGVSDPPYQNPVNAFDVNGDGFVSPIDSLILINHINTFGPGPVPEAGDPPPFLDPSGNNAVTAEDILLVVTELNRLAAVGPSGEGEGEAADVPDAVALELQGLQTSQVVTPLFGDSDDASRGFDPATGRLLPSAMPIVATAVRDEPSDFRRAKGPGVGPVAAEARVAEAVFADLDLDGDLDETLELIAEEIDRAEGPSDARDAWFRHA